MPKAVGETASGDPVFEVRGVRLALRDHASFFNRLVPCGNCGRETLGSAVRSPADLDLPPGPATCRECRRAAAAASPPLAEPPPQAAPAVPPPEDTSAPRIDALEARIAELQAALEAQGATAAAAEAAGREAAAEVTGLGKRLTQRLEKIEAKGQPAGGDTQRIEALERRVEQVATLMAEREARLEEQLGEARALAAASVTDIEERVRAVEARADEAAEEAEELGDLHAALDVGLGQLRSELAVVREGQRSASLLQDEFDRRLETVAAIQRAVSVEEGKGRRGGKRSAEFATQVVAAQAATDELAKEQKQLRAQLSVIELASDRAAETADRAWGQVVNVGPLRMAVDALEERLEIQHEALAALTESVQGLLSSGPAKAPAARKAPAKKAPAAKKAARPAKRPSGSSPNRSA